MADKCLKCHERDALPEQTRCYECGGYRVRVDKSQFTYEQIAAFSAAAATTNYPSVMAGLAFRARLEAHEGEGTSFTPEETVARHAAWDAQIAQRNRDFDPHRPVLDIPTFMAGQKALLDRLVPEAKPAESWRPVPDDAIIQHHDFAQVSAKVFTCAGCKMSCRGDVGKVEWNGIGALSCPVNAAHRPAESWAARKARYWIAEATPPKPPGYVMKPEAVQQMMELAIAGAIKSTIAECARVANQGKASEGATGFLAVAYENWREVIVAAIRKLGEP